MAEAVAGDLTDFRLLCSVACRQNPVEIKNTEVVASILLDNMRLMAGDREHWEAANAILNAHMENFQDVMDEQEELDERIAFGMSVTPEDTNDGGSDYDPILKGRSPFVTAAVAAAATPAVVAAAAATQYTNLISFVNNLKSDNIAGQLIDNMNILNQELARICRGHAYVYNNILFFNPGRPDTIRDTSLFPKYSFNILCNQNSFLLPQLLVLGERGVGSILQYFVCNVFNRLFSDFVTNNIIQFKIFNPTDTNKLWQVKICLFGNEFTFISIQIISMAQGFFTDDSIQNDDDLIMTLIQALCFLLYNKCLSKDFNCLCSLSELDIKLFRAIFRAILEADPTFVLFTNFIRHFFNNLSETQLNVKKQYFIMGLYNLASCSYNPDYTPETRAYELLFNQAPVGIDLFNRSMCFIKELNQRSFPGFPEQIRFAMGGGKLYSIFHKKLKEICNQDEIPGEGEESRQARITLAGRLRLNVLQAILEEIIKAAADADFGCFYHEGIIPALGASSCMAICMLLQLSLKRLIDGLFAPAPPAPAPPAPAPPAPAVPAAAWQDSEIDIGNSCIGTPPTTLSSLRIVLKNISRFYLINNAVAGTPAADILQWLQGIFNLGNDITNNIKATISPYDFVMKGSMESYIVHIFEAVHSYINTGILPARFPAIAQFLSTYCMITEEGFSSPIKGILDIFYTLFIIENFANRTFVTQKINKELKRVAICAQILLLHYTELPPNEVTQTIIPIIPILTRMIGYGYGSDLLGHQFGDIMQTYVQFVSVLCHIFSTDVNYLYFSVAGVAIPGVTRQITTIETIFMQLLTECRVNVPVVNVPLNQEQYNYVITSLRDMGHATNDLYLNKLYASCRDTENKKNGIVAIMSAYQAYLWDTGKINMITRDADNDNCGYILPRNQEGIIEPQEGIIQHLVATPTVFDSLLQLIVPFANADVLGMAWSIAQINADDILRSRIANTVPDNTAPVLLNTFLVFSWFITSVFGVKTKSKPSKVISLGRNYLQLLISSPPGEQRPFPLFRLPIDIPDALPAAPAAVPAMIDIRIVPEVVGELPVDIAQGNDVNRLCLAYNQANIRSAINKYIKMDIDMNVDAARVTAAAAAAAFNLDTAQQAAIQQDAIQQASNDVQQVNGTYTISVTTGSLVFNQEIFSELIIRFSHLPRGNQFILGAAQYMRPIMRRICCLIDTRQQATIGESMTSINNFYPYRPTPHDVSKFTMLNDGMRNAWLQYLINKIFAVEGGNPQTVFDNMKLFVLLYNYIVPVGQAIVFPDHPPNINYLDVVGPLINEHFIVCQTGIEALLRLSTSWESQEPRVIAAAAAAGVTAKKKQEAIEAAKGDTSATQTNSVKKATGNKPTAGSRAAAAAATAGVLRATRVNQIRHSGGNRPNNHTRRNKNKRKKNSKTKTKFKTKSSPKHKKVIPSSRSGSQSNRKKSKPKKSQKNVTFKRRRARK